MSPRQPRPKIPPLPTSKTAQNAIVRRSGSTQAKIPAALPEAKQTKLDGVLAMLDELTKQEIKTVIAKITQLTKGERVHRIRLPSRIASTSA